MNKEEYNAEVGAMATAEARAQWEEMTTLENDPDFIEGAALFDLQTSLATLDKIAKERALIADRMQEKFLIEHGKVERWPHVARNLYTLEALRKGLFAFGKEA